MVQNRAMLTITYQQ